MLQDREHYKNISKHFKKVWRPSKPNQFDFKFKKTTKKDL
jgi:hypothetical protein